jgi:hypothetical protein
MRERTLVTHRLYFGMDALSIRAAAARVLARVAGLPPERARINARHLRQDFGVNTIQCTSLVSEFVQDGMLELRDELPDEFKLTRRFHEFATARVVEPLTRDRAKQLLAKIVQLATEINAEWNRNPLEIEAIATFGCYMSRSSKLAELPIGIIVRPRAPSRRARWGSMSAKSDGANDIRAAMKDVSTFVRVRLMNDTMLLPRPFAVAFQDD